MGQEILVTTVLAFDAGETISNDAAVKIAVDHLFDISTELRNWAAADHRKPLILRGARQVGKTTAVEMFSKE